MRPKARDGLGDGGLGELLLLLHEFRSYCYCYMSFQQARFSISKPLNSIVFAVLGLVDIGQVVTAT